MFKDLRENGLLYILDKKELKLEIGQVLRTGKTPPVMGQYQYGVEPTIDVEVKIGEIVSTFTKLPPMLSIATSSPEGLVISDNSDAMFNEVAAMERISDEALKSIPYHEKVKETVIGMKKTLNHQFAKEVEREEKIGKLESRMNGIDGKLDAILQSLSKQKNQKYEND